ncbi:MAG: polysaccharide deacetylase family protein [Bacteroidota bacterium]
MVHFVSPPYFIRRFYKKLIWNFPTTEKIIYLTFDDGPIPEVTPFVLDQLKQYNAKATFFCIGENIDKHPEIFKHVKDQGHTTGNHTYHHLNGWDVPDSIYFESVERTRAFVGTKFFRPPYGRIRKSQIAMLEARFSIIMWDVLSYDFDKNVSPEKCFSNVMRHAKGGSIVLFHDSIKAQKNLYYALPKTLEHFSKAGFEFRAIV